MGKEDGLTQKKVSFYKLFSFADRFDAVLMVVGTFAAVMNGLMQPVMTLIFGQIINTFGSSTDSSRILHHVSQNSLDLIYLAIAAGVASFLQVSCWIATGERQTARIRTMYLRTILRQDVEFFDSEVTTGEIIGRMSGDTILIQDAIGEKVGKFIQLVSTFLGGFLIALTRGWLLGLVLLSCLPFLVAAGAFTSFIMAKMSSRSITAYANAGNIVDQTIGAIRTVAAFNGEKIAIENYDRKLKIAYVAAARQGLVSGMGSGSAMFIIFSIYAVAVWYGARLIIDKGYNGGEVVNVLMATIIGGSALGQTSPSMCAFASGQSSAYKMFETIKRKPNIDAYKTNGVKLEEIEGEIELKDVFFRYPSRPDVNIFSGFSLKVESGTTVALVGQSGSGKSTVISLLERFYDPDSGEVLIDGVNLKEFQLKWLRDQMGLVSQEPVLFTTSIRENICYAKENATQEEITRAIKLANAANFIDKMPQGIDTMVGQNGTQLSGGQKQRIAIARAILKDPRILLLDEATSALDTESERVVQDALTKIMSNRTTVVVAHRLTTIRNANLIAVVQSGKLVEQGTHEQLIQDSSGAYSQLVRLQEGAKEDLEETNDMIGDIGTISKRPSLKRSLSRGSSGTGSMRSFVVPSILPSPIEIQLQVEEEQEEEDDQKRRNVSIRRLAYLNKPELPILLVGTITAGITGLIFPIFGLLISSAIKIFYEPKEQLRKDSMFWSLLYVLMGVISFIALPVQNYLFGMAGGKLIQRIRSLTFKKVVHQEISWFDDPANSSGAVGARLSTDAANVKGLVGDTLSVLVQSIVTVGAGIIIAFTANWILAFILLLVLPLMGLQGFLQMRSLKGYSKDAKVMYEEASQVASDAVGNIRTVASFCAEKKVMEMYEKKCEEPTKNGVRTGLISGCGYGFGYLLLYCANAFCFYIGAILVQHGKADFAQVFRVFFTLSMTATAISQSSALAPDSNKARDSTASIFHILDAEVKIDSSKDEGTTLPTLKGDIELDHVSFRYPRRQDIQIFKDICLKIPSGQTVALVGESGSGKSTVISLIERFYDPISGRVLIDGIDITTMKLKWLRQQMALVSQEPILFNETIRENIAYSKKGEASEDEIVSAAKAANAHNFIAGLPQGYETNVGERGVQLSGGQKQRIAIARAMLKEPKILLLDEATSALDAESERIVQDALDKVMVNRTTVVVAHRMSTIKGADMIAVVKNGVIAENGTHEMLMKITGGVYASLLAMHPTVST